VNEEKYRLLLLARRDELVALDAVDQEGRAPVTLDQTSVGRLSRMDALQSQAMALELERRRHQELARIEAAFTRIELGDYGYCAVCGDEIPEKRLEFDPTAPSCVDCADQKRQ
jgi:DnaK suppressor protein